MPNDEDKTEAVGFEIGYGKPPKQSQFRKGKSGNPKGRPKGSKNLASIVLAECRQPVRISGPRGPRTVTKLEAVVMQLSHQSAQGKIPATREFVGLVQHSEESAVQLKGAPTPEADQKTLQNLLKRVSLNKVKPEET